jgi:putative FmdB family regulatory protein
MPIYEYECDECGVRFEKLQRMADPALTKCPECSGHIHRVIQPVGVIFKGSGFYVTDNRGKSSTGIPGNKKKEDEGKASADGTSSTPAGAESVGASTGPASASTSSSSPASKETKASKASDDAGGGPA